eukprot:10061503-Alexandrium_andersonii.AAC.1
MVGRRGPGSLRARCKGALPAAAAPGRTSAAMVIVSVLHGRAAGPGVAASALHGRAAAAATPGRTSAAAVAA